jgi:hypothetical protein
MKFDMEQAEKAITYNKYLQLRIKRDFEHAKSLKLSGRRSRHSSHQVELEKCGLAVEPREP